jgi:hypothetical protein
MFLCAETEPALNEASHADDTLLPIAPGDFSMLP